MDGNKVENNEVISLNKPDVNIHCKSTDDYEDYEINNNNPH